MAKTKPETFKLIDRDPMLGGFYEDIALRMRLYRETRARLLGEVPGKRGTGRSPRAVKDAALENFADGHLYYGFHKTETGWVYREWAPEAEAMALIGDFNGWKRQAAPMRRLNAGGDWEVEVPELPHGSLVKVQVTHCGQTFDRIPLYIHRVIQDTDGDFKGQIWDPAKPYRWTDGKFTVPDAPLCIYEAHVGMSSERPGIASYDEFADQVLPRIQKDGYNAVQLMAIMQHPYYASFGYQVTNFFAASSWYGEPEGLKRLINKAHRMGIAVLLDVVHSHAAPNTNDGLGAFDGTDYQFFHAGAEGNHPAWGTKLFDYGKPQVIHFLLSNLKYWMEEYHFDGFRFDGVTSMLYHNHGLGIDFDNYGKYFSMNTDTEAITYLQLANVLVHSINKKAVTIAEDMSGMPGMALPVAEGGIGFDYRLGMGIPDFWVRTVSKVSDEFWDMGKMWYELTTRRPGEKSVSYAESHDQALVGDKTIMFWLADQEMYWHMQKNDPSQVIERAVALHKMIRLVTMSLGDGYLNFMGNEFGHPEWIDFPREGNGNSYHYCRRQWSLADNPDLKYHGLLEFDNAMLQLNKEGTLMTDPQPKLLFMNQNEKTVAFVRGDYLLVFNFHPTNDAVVDLHSLRGEQYRLVFSTAEERFAGWMKEGELPFPETFPVPDTVDPSTLALKATDLWVPRRVAVVYKKA